ncbi:MAG TPA: SUMF1/EgtB/PvdO family nonheme iron enzyme, partial [Anaerovoracaceae bacterium]|nr:SUMF1/EgtB/PvdO family nonheme iron enzyme [Anaerovoracaceae bacterium]
GIGLDISNDGKLLAITGNDDEDKPVIHIWDIEHFNYLRSIPVKIYIKPKKFNYEVLFHPDGFIIFSGYEDEIRFYDPETVQLIGNPLSTGDDVLAIALSPDGNYLAVEHSKDADENLQLWNLETRQKIGVLELNEENHLDYQYTLGIEFSPDSKTLAAGLNGGFIIFWDLETFQLIGDPIIVSKNISPIKSLTYSPDGKIVASGSDEGIIQLWNVQTRYSIGVPMVVNRGDITNLLFNSSGTTLYSSDDKGEINIWDVSSQQPIGLSITSSNSRQLSYNLDDKDPIFGHNGHQSTINTMVLTQYDSILFSMDNKGVIRTWNLNFEYLAKKACLRAGRNLTQNEWNRFLPNEAYRMTCPLFTPFYTKDQSDISTDSSKEFITRTRDSDHMVQVFVPAGEFEMGSRTWTDNGEPFMLIMLDDFWIDQTEVTNRQYAACEKSGNCTRPASNSSATRISTYYNNEIFFDYPVIFVSMQQAEEYCEWVGGRIPTEAEWEKAARGTDGFDFPWGNSDPKSTLANFHDLIGDTTKVGSFPQGISPYGALDMAGNVYEWTKDAYEYEIDKSDVPDKIRGGAWNKRYVYTWVHENTFAGYYFYDIGFRCISDS